MQCKILFLLPRSFRKETIRSNLPKHLILGSQVFEEVVLGHADSTVRKGYQVQSQSSLWVSGEPGCRDIPAEATLTTAVTASTYTTLACQVSAEHVTYITQSSPAYIFILGYSVAELHSSLAVFFQCSKPLRNT